MDPPRRNAAPAKAPPKDSVSAGHGSASSLESDCSSSSQARSRRRAVESSALATRPRAVIPRNPRGTTFPGVKIRLSAGGPGDWVGGDVSVNNERCIQATLPPHGSGVTKTAIRISLNDNETHASVEQRTRSEAGKSEMYRVTTSESSAPHGVRQRVSTLEDTKTGLKQMVFGRQIGDRSYILEKSRNQYTGEEVIREELVNIGEHDDFTREWKARTGV